MNPTATMDKKRLIRDLILLGVIILIILLAVKHDIIVYKERARSCEKCLDDGDCSDYYVEIYNPYKSINFSYNDIEK